MEKMIPIENLDYNKCYERVIEYRYALAEVDIIDGEYMGRNGNPIIEAVDAVPRQQIEKLLKIFEGIAAMDGTCSAHYVVRMLHNFTD